MKLGKAVFGSRNFLGRRHRRGTVSGHAMKMRELEAATGVDREVIRILLRKGLLPEPIRPARNAAEYDESHVRAVAVVRNLQKNSRMTLDQIKEALAGNTPGLDAGASTYKHLEELLAIRFGFDESPAVPLSALVARQPMAERDARAFASMAMISIIETPDGPHLSITDARIVEIWGLIRQAGFVEETGFPPENIAYYLEAAKLVATREAEVFMRGSAGRISEERAAIMLQIALPLMTDFFGMLRLKEFMNVIHSLTDPASSAST